MAIEYQNPTVVDLQLDAESLGGSPVVFRERVIPSAGAAGGCTIFHRVAAGSGDAVNIKASAGQIYAIDVFNIGDIPAFIKFHNTAGTPTPGANVELPIGVQAGTGRTVSFPVGIAFDTGIAMTIVTGIADADSTGVAAASVVVCIGLK